jgi:hypothetical protein
VKGRKAHQNSNFVFEDGAIVEPQTKQKNQYIFLRNTINICE